MKDVGGSEDLRNFEIEVLTFERRMISEDFTPFERLNAESTREEMVALFENVEKDAKEEAGKLKKFRELQKAFADKNGLKLERNTVVPGN